MRSYATFAVLSSAVGLAAAGVERRWDYPESFLAARQDADPEPGTPRYACHENCGLAITLGRETENHCSDNEWNQRYGSCLECANTFGIWVYYGRSIAVYATECGLTPEPSVSGWEAAAPSTSAAAVVTTSSPAAQAPTTSAPATQEPATSAGAVTTSAGAVTPPQESAVESGVESAVESAVQSGYPVPEQSTTLSQVASAASSAAAVPSVPGNSTIPEPSHVPSAAGNVAASFGLALVAAVLALAL